MCVSAIKANKKLKSMPQCVLKNVTTLNIAIEYRKKNSMLSHERNIERIRLRIQYEVAKSSDFQTNKFESNRSYEIVITYFIRCLRIETGYIGSAVSGPSVGRPLDAVKCDLRSERNSPAEV